MFRYITKEVKEVVLQMILQHISYREIQGLTSLGRRTIARIAQTYRLTGDVTRIPVVAGRSRMLDALDATFLEGCIERQPDLTLEELQVHLWEVCGVSASCQTISRTLRRRGFTRKFLARPAIERDEEDRAMYKMIVGEHYLPEQLVFCDESHFNRLTLRRRFGWSPIGSRARRRDFFIRGTRYTILPAMSLDGVLHLEVLDHAFTGVEFQAFVEGVLGQMQPFPLPNSVLVCDNASIHHVPGLRELVESRGMRLLHLPAYSPDLNPIEEGFSAMKAWLRANREYVLAEREGHDCDPYTLIWEAVYSTLTSENAHGWFQHSEYMV